MKKDKLITIRISEEDRKLINEIKDRDINFNLSNFFREIIARKWIKVTNPSGIGFMRIGEPIQPEK